MISSVIKRLAEIRGERTDGSPGVMKEGNDQHRLAAWAEVWIC